VDGQHVQGDFFNRNSGISFLLVDYLCRHASDRSPLVCQVGSFELPTVVLGLVKAAAAEACLEQPSSTKQNRRQMQDPTQLSQVG
jgi:hypothetical protein